MSVMMPLFLNKSPPANPGAKEAAAAADGLIPDVLGPVIVVFFHFGKNFTKYTENICHLTHTIKHSYPAYIYFIEH